MRIISGILKGKHLSLLLRQADIEYRAIAWRWTGNYPIKKSIDIAFYLDINDWNGNECYQLDIASIPSKNPIDESFNKNN